MALMKSMLNIFGRSAFAPQLCAATSRFYAAPAAEEKISLEVMPFKAHRIDPPDNKVETTVKELLSLFEIMYRMRRMETAADLAYKAKLIRGFCHLYDGQEAVTVGMEAALNMSDSIITSYRDHCQYLSRGGTVKEVMAELFGRSEGATRGVGGSMHFYNKGNHFYGGCGIVGAQIPLGAGLGFAHKYKKDGSVAVTMYGDGAANQGQKYEALNMAGLWNLPVIFVCENNHYGMGTAEWRGSKSPNFYTRGDYIPGLKVDGMDVLAVKQAFAFAKSHALQNGPIILELDTYRYHGHSMSDPGSTYRTRDEIASMRSERDPIERVRKLLSKLEVDVAQLKGIERQIKKEVDSAIEEAKASPIPPMHWLWKNVYQEPGQAQLRDVPGTYKVPDYDPAYAS